MKDHECKIKEGDVVVFHDDYNSCAIRSVAKVEKVLQPKDNKVWGEKIAWLA